MPKPSEALVWINEDGSARELTHAEQLVRATKRGDREASDLLVFGDLGDWARPE